MPSWFGIIMDTNPPDDLSGCLGAGLVGRLVGRIGPLLGMEPAREKDKPAGKPRMANFNGPRDTLRDNKIAAH